jgi:hypothetical protein
MNDHAESQFPLYDAFPPKENEEEFMVFYHKDRIIGKLFTCYGKLVFRGNAEASAGSFFETLSENFERKFNN